MPPVTMTLAEAANEASVPIHIAKLAKLAAGVNPSRITPGMPVYPYRELRQGEMVSFSFGSNGFSLEGPSRVVVRDSGYAR